MPPTMPEQILAVQDTNIGRGLLTTRDVQAGELLLDEEPLLVYLAELDQPGTERSPSEQNADSPRERVCASCYRMKGTLGIEYVLRHAFFSFFSFAFDTRVPAQVQGV